MPIANVVRQADLVSPLSPWVWDYDVDGSSMGSRDCGHFSAVVISRYGDPETFDYLIFDERDPDADPVYESSRLRYMSRQAACNNATREIRWRAEREATHRLVPLPRG